MIEVNPQTVNQIAECLLQYEAVKIQVEKPFVWSSGWLSPIYCDNRRLLSFPEARKLIIQGFIDTIERDKISFDGIIGVATGAIAYGALLADYYNVPFAYVRSSPKRHGLGNQVEGVIQPNKRYLLIEDLISTGGSSYKAMEAACAAGAIIPKVYAIFTYDFLAAQQTFATASVTCLCDFQHLLTIAAANGYFHESKIPNLLTWRSDPEKWGKEQQ